MLSARALPAEEKANCNPHIIFVGMGPIGLWTAIQTKLYQPHLTILAIEKHPEYQRTHTLELNHKSFNGSHPDEALQKILSTFPARVQTTEIENKLLAYAKKLGIQMQTSTVKDCQVFAKEFPTASVIVGSDGAHSVVRHEIFGDQLVHQRDMQYIAEVKYFAEGATRPLQYLEMTNSLTKGLI